MDKCVLCKKTLKLLTKTIDWNKRKLHLKCYNKYIKEIDELLFKCKICKDLDYMEEKRNYFKKHYDIDIEKIDL